MNPGPRGENAPLLPLRGEPCSLCEGAACEEQCGRRTGCRAMSGGPDDHRVCTRCGGRGTQSTDALREAIADAVGPNLSVYGSSPGAQEFADGVCDSIVDDVLDALGLEQVGVWCSNGKPYLVLGSDIHDADGHTHEAVYRLAPLGSSGPPSDPDPTAPLTR